MSNIQISEAKPNKYIVLGVLILSFLGIFSFWSKSTIEGAVRGTVLEVLSEREVALEIGNNARLITEQELSVEITEGDDERIVNVFNDYKPVAKGDKIFVSAPLFEDSEFTVVDISRMNPLIFLFIFFILLVILTSGWKGFYSLVGLLFTFVVIFIFIVPQILKGVNPISVSVLGASIILVPTLYLSYGFNKKSISALIGIVAALLFVGVLSHYFIGALSFTGFSEVSIFLDMEASNSINLIGLLIAGIIIAAVGVLDDVAVIQSSVVFSLARTNPELRGLKLFKEAMHVGRDHISAVVNTLVLAYTGASLPLIILLYIREMPLDYFVSLEIVAQEIARTLISSSGLLLAVPMTTLVATAIASRRRKDSPQAY
jgi:uncharacterized membrane protein